MYKMSYYAGQSSQELISFMRAHSFAVVTGMGDKYPVASHLPLEIITADDKLFLTGHLMRKTDHHNAFEKNENVLVVFNSPYAVIDASWYENPTQASTVNYMAVHAKGKISFTDEAGTYDAIRQLTNKHIGTDAPGAFTKMPEEYVNAMLKAIVGFRIEVESLENVFKLSQNRNAADQQNIIAQLEKRKEPGSDYIAKQMKQRL